jgi:carbonic anhydrase/acetyltransferase-like protein (isoleucine patch superfamily)
MTSHPGALILPYQGKQPRIDPTAFVAPGARIVGDVVIGPQASIWYNCVLRGDINRIVIGARSNVQDGTIIHVEDGEPGLPVLIGDDALIGHMAILHGCTVGAGGFVGMGAVVMDGSAIEAGGMLAAGALLPPGKVVPTGQLWTGRPAAFMRPLTAAQQQAMARQSRKYLGMAEGHRQAVDQHRAALDLD